MAFIPYIYDNNGKQVFVNIENMTESDAEETIQQPRWQTSWKSEFISNPSIKKYAVKNNDQLIALGAYEVVEDKLYVHIVYMEAHPGSNPTMHQGAPEYTGIGRLLVAFGISLSVTMGFNGDVILEAKTSELARHYANDFGALELPRAGSVAPRFLICDEAAQKLLSPYLKEED